MADAQTCGPADPVAGGYWRGAVRIHIVLRRVCALAADGWPAQHPPAGNLGHDYQRYLASALCAGNPYHHRIVRGDHTGVVVDGPDPTPACAPEPTRACRGVTPAHKERRAITYDAGWRP